MPLLSPSCHHVLLSWCLQLLGLCVCVCVCVCMCVCVCVRATMAQPDALFLPAMSPAGCWLTLLLLLEAQLNLCPPFLAGEGMSKEALACVVQQMLLTPHQQQRIADGEALFKRLLAPVIRARQQLQGSGFGSASGHTEGGCAGGAAAPAACLDGFPARTDALHQQQVKVANLTTLMKKVGCSAGSMPMRGWFGWCSTFLHSLSPIVIVSNSLQ